MQHWYALHSKPHKEDAVWEQLRLRAIETFYPRLYAQPVNPRARKVKPFFPGYLFVRVDLEQVGTSMFEWMPFANGLVQFGGVPAHVPDPLIAAVQSHLDEINVAGGEVLYKVKPGDRVEIKDGAFVGYEAIFDQCLNGGERVRVLLQMLSDRQILVELHVSQIRCR